MYQPKAHVVVLELLDYYLNIIARPAPAKMAFGSETWHYDGRVLHSLSVSLENHLNGLHPWLQRARDARSKPFRSAETSVVLVSVTDRKSVV